MGEIRIFMRWCKGKVAREEGVGGEPKKSVNRERLWSYPQILELAHRTYCGPRADRYKWSYIYITL